MPLVIENDIESRLKARVEHFGGWCIKYTPTSLTGFPDRIVLMPGGALRFVELKRPKGGRLSPVQRWVHERLECLGFHVAVVRNYEEIETLLEEMRGGHHGV